jgi:hypothetical protein
VGGGDRCFRLRFRIAYAVLERVARAVSPGRVLGVGMRLHHHAAGTARLRKMRELENTRSKARARCDGPIGLS